jgi:hypothetical protein
LRRRKMVAVPNLFMIVALGVAFILGLLVYRMFR